MNHKIKISALVFLVATAQTLLASEQVNMEPSAFIASAFDQDVPGQQVVWINGDLRDRIADVLGHEPGFMRVRYWNRDDRTVFILDEIGKERPITAGFVVDDGVLDKVQVLVFRESRGWEVKYPFFADQFVGATLRPEGLDRNIDGISGATLSVRAVTRLAEVALVLDRHLRGNVARFGNATDRLVKK
jgi:hypothetical protein